MSSGTSCINSVECKNKKKCNECFPHNCQTLNGRRKQKSTQQNCFLFYPAFPIKRSCLHYPKCDLTTECAMRDEFACVTKQMSSQLQKSDKHTSFKLENPRFLSFPNCARFLTVSDLSPFDSFVSHLMPYYTEQQCDNYSLKK